MKSFFKVYCFILLFILTSKAQNINYRRYAEQDGLLNKFVYCINQDKLHFLWVATAEGLVRYDGKNFLTFSIANGLAENFVYSIFIDKNDNKWIGHYNGGITMFDNHSFKIIDTKKYFTSRINKFYQNSENEIIICTQNDGLWMLTKENKLIELTSEFTEKPIINDVLQLENKSYLIATNEGIIVLKKDALNQKYSKNLVQDTEYYAIISLIEHKDKIIYATEYDGIFNIKFDENFNFTSKKFTLNANQKNTGKIIFINKDKNNRLYISYENGSFSQNIVSENEISQTTLYQISNDKYATFCKSMLVDLEDNLWIGTYGNGLLQSFGNVFLSYSNQFDFTQENINTLTIKDQKIYFSVKNELFMYDIAIDEYKQLMFDIDIKELQTHDIKDIIIDEYNNIYISIDDKGVYVSNLKKLNFKEFFCHFEDKPSCSVNCITKDGEKNLWLATENGAFKVDLIKTKIQRFGIDNGLPHNKVNCITRDSKNRFWFATQSSGISYFQDGKLFKLHSPLENIAVSISTIYEDKFGNIWFGTYGKGIMRYKNGVFDKQFSKLDGMGSDFCYTIIEDANGFLWIGHKNGFSKVNMETSEINYYENNTEYSDAEVNLNAVSKENDSKIWYGTNHGLIKFDSNNDRKNIIENSNVITSIKLFFNEPQWNLFKVRKQITTPPQNLQFKHNQNHLKFEFIGISLKSPDNVKYKFYLDGFEKEWSQESKQNYATYSNLPPGNYIFKVISKNKDGKWNKKPVEYAFSIDAPFWQKWWFILMSILLFFGLTFSVFYYRTYNLRKRNVFLLKEKLKLEYEISERKTIEKKLNESQRLLELSHSEMNEFMWRLYHDLKSPLKSIKGLVNIALTAPPKTEDSQKYYKLIGITTDKLDAILTDFAKIKTLSDFDFSSDLINFEELIDEVIVQLKKQYNLELFNIIIENKTNDLKIYTDKSSLEMIFINIFRNSIIYANHLNPYLKIRIKSYKKNICILIADNGIGIERMALSKVFNMFYKGTEKSKGTGLGLYLTKKYIEMMKGNISISSTKSKGTVVLLQFPNTPPQK